MLIAWLAVILLTASPNPYQAGAYAVAAIGLNIPVMIWACAGFTTVN